MREGGLPTRSSIFDGRTVGNQLFYAMMGFDYNAPADFFPARGRMGRSIHYRRFDTAAEAIRFAVEELPAPLLLGAYLQVDDERFAADQIRALYASAAYPFDRTA
jgi:hypothetical protein